MRIGSSQWAKLIIEGAKSFGLDLSPEQVSRFGVHAGELIKWNKKFNLTRITDPREMALKHYLDSLAPACWIPPSCTLLDIGSGGGFPGIPLKIVNPSLTLTLIDGSRKKINFLKHCLRVLDLGKSEALQVRGQELTVENDTDGGGDVIISRAVASLAEFAQIALPLLAEKGTVIALKGKVDAGEIDALSKYLSKIQDRSENHRLYSLTHHAYLLPFDQAERSIIIIKSKSTKSQNTNNR
jgi:16S rRNA (guanine527-N7)-methyltransferase